MNGQNSCAFDHEQLPDTVKAKHNIPGIMTAERGKNEAPLTVAWGQSHPSSPATVATSVAGATFLEYATLPKRQTNTAAASCDHPHAHGMAGRKASHPSPASASSLAMHPTTAQPVPQGGDAHGQTRHGPSHDWHGATPDGPPVDTTTAVKCARMAVWDVVAETSATDRCTGRLSLMAPSEPKDTTYVPMQPDTGHSQRGG